MNCSLAWVDAALNLILTNEQNPRPEATAKVTNRTPANPRAPWESTTLVHCLRVTQAYMSYGANNKSCHVSSNNNINT